MQGWRMVLTTQVVGVTVHLMQSVPCIGGASYWLYTSGRGCYRGSDAECTYRAEVAHGTDCTVYTSGRGCYGASDAECTMQR
jgi:hypothetical protein